MRPSEHRKRVMVYILTIILAYFCSRFFIQILMVHGESMAPTYNNMELVFLNRFDRSYTYGDVIAFHSENDTLPNILLKRIAAIPGDRVIIEDGILYINGKSSQVYGRDVVFEYAGIVEDEVTLQRDEYFVIGDNVEQSKDSRYQEIGIVRENMIVGKLVASKQAG